MRHGRRILPLQWPVTSPPGPFFAFIPWISQHTLLDKWHSEPTKPRTHRGPKCTQFSICIQFYESRYYVSGMNKSQFKISGYHGGVAEHSSLLESDAVSLGKKSPKFRRVILPSSSWTNETFSLTSVPCSWLALRMEHANEHGRLCSRIQP
jgi:hypothetical protein